MKVRQRKTSRAITSLHVQLDRLIESIGGRKFTAAERKRIVRLVRAMFVSDDPADRVRILELGFGEAPMVGESSKGKTTRG